METNEINLVFRPTNIWHNNYTVNIIQPDGTAELIGFVSIDSAEEGETARYVLSDTKGNEIFPPTDDFTEAERKFERYAKRIADEKRVKEMTEKEVEIKKIRERNNKDRDIALSR